DVAGQVRARIDQLLVDEFQDTDADQCEIVARLALEVGRSGPGLFVVGDPKQSIYGWRNADLAAYERFREQLRAAGGAVHRLCVNHRSRSAVLAEVERAIAPVMQPRAGLQPAFEPLLPGAHGGTDDEAPAIEYWIAGDWAELAGEDGARRTLRRAASEREADRLAADLLRLQREARAAGAPFHWRDVGILLRTTGDVDLYLDALRRARIPYAIGRDRQYGRRREVVEARALVRAVLDPTDQIALVAALRAPWSGVPDAAWRPLWRRGLPDLVRRLLDGDEAARPALAAIAREAAREVRAQAASVPGLAAVEGWELGLLHAADVLAALRRSFEREPVARFVERLR